LRILLFITLLYGNEGFCISLSNRYINTILRREGILGKIFLKCKKALTSKVCISIVIILTIISFIFENQISFFSNLFNNPKWIQMFISAKKGAFISSSSISQILVPGLMNTLAIVFAIIFAIVQLINRQHPLNMFNKYLKKPIIIYSIIYYMFTIVLGIVLIFLKLNFLLLEIVFMILSVICLFMIVFLFYEIKIVSPSETIESIEADLKELLSKNEDNRKLCIKKMSDLFNFTKGCIISNESNIVINILDTYVQIIKFYVSKKPSFIYENYDVECRELKEEFWFEKAIIKHMLNILYLSTKTNNNIIQDYYCNKITELIKFSNRLRMYAFTKQLFSHTEEIIKYSILNSEVKLFSKAVRILFVSIHDLLPEGESELIDYLLNYIKNINTNAFIEASYSNFEDIITGYSFITLRCIEIKDFFSYNKIFNEYFECLYNITEVQIEKKISNLVGASLSSIVLALSEGYNEKSNIENTLDKLEIIASKSMLNNWEGVNEFFVAVLQEIYRKSIQSNEFVAKLIMSITFKIILSSIKYNKKEFTIS
jgi:hypothetical protein